MLDYQHLYNYCFTMIAYILQAWNEPARTIISRAGRGKCVIGRQWSCDIHLPVFWILGVTNEHPTNKGGALQCVCWWESGGEDEREKIMPASVVEMFGPTTGQWGTVCTTGLAPLVVWESAEVAVRRGSTGMDDTRQLSSDLHHLDTALMEWNKEWLWNYQTRDSYGGELFGCCQFYSQAIAPWEGGLQQYFLLLQ